MVEDHGSGERWQQWATGEWVRRLAIRDTALQLLEGQTRPSFINEALGGASEIEPVLILLHCRAEVREYRLTELRGRPELVTPRMEAWAAYLRGQADALGLPVIDTSDQDLEAVASEVARLGLAGLSRLP